MQPWKQATYEQKLEGKSCRAMDIEGLLSNQKEKLQQQLVKRATTNALPTNTKRKTETEAQENRKDMKTRGLFKLNW